MSEVPLYLPPFIGQAFLDPSLAHHSGGERSRWTAVALECALPSGIAGVPRA